MSKHKLMTVQELAELLNLSPYTVREKAKAGCWKKWTRKVGNQWRFVRAKALEYAGVDPEEVHA